MFRTAFFLASALTAGLLTAAESQTVQTFSVERTFNNSPFAVRIESSEQKPGYRILRMTYPSPLVTVHAQNNTVPAEYFLPDGAESGPKRPAVIGIHILDGSMELVRMLAAESAARGVPAIIFKLPFYGERSPTGGRDVLAKNPTLFLEALPQAILDVRRTVDLLAARPEIDPQKIGVAGISLGGIVAATAAASEPRIARAGLVLAGGDLLSIIHGCSETRKLSETIKRLPVGEAAKLEKAITAIDPLTAAPGLRSRAIAGRVLMINAGADEVIPPACARKLADALGIADRIVWLDGLGHYTALATLPQTLRQTVEFFAQDLPANARTASTTGTASDPVKTILAIASQAISLASSPPAEGRCHRIDAEISANDSSKKPITGRLSLVRGAGSRFRIEANIPNLGRGAAGYDVRPWLASDRTVFLGSTNGSSKMGPLDFADPAHLAKAQLLAAGAAGLALAPRIVEQALDVQPVSTSNAPPAFEIRQKDKPHRGKIRLALDREAKTPASASFDVQGVQGEVVFHAWDFNAPATGETFQPPAGLTIREVDSADICRIFSAVFDFAMEGIGPMAAASTESRDPAGHGAVFQQQGKTILVVDGTPEQMGAAQGTLLKASAKTLTTRVLFVVGGVDTLHGNAWFLDRMAEIQRRTLPHIPPRFLAEIDSLSDAAGISRRDGRFANLFPERFHCSGVAVRGKASKNGQVVHARVLDYMRDINLQSSAAVQVYLPKDRHAWMSLGYAGFIGTVTAMNEKGLAIGEMGGRGEGDWDGMPMSFLLRDVAERAANVPEALEILRKTPRTCEYYYVLSDRSKNLAAVHATPKEFLVLNPGEQHPDLPRVPDDAVLISGGSRAKHLSDRLFENYGRIDAEAMIQIIRRPVAMSSNLHNAIFLPESLDMWFADAGKHTPACDEPYARVNLPDLIRRYREAARYRESTPSR